MDWKSAGGGTTVTEVTDENAADILGDGSLSYDAATNTLTMNGCTLTPGSGVEAVSTTGKDLNLVLVGSNTITGQGIYVDGDLTITGGGSLTVTGSVYSINAVGGITIDAATVTASNSTTTGAIQSNNGAVTIRNGAKVVANTTGYAGNPICAKTDLSISDSTVEAIANGAWAYSAIKGDGSITITNSKVTANSYSDAGICSNGSISITSSTVNATGAVNCAILGAKLSVSGGKVTAISNKETSVYAFNEITISNSAEVNVTSDLNCGIWASDTLRIEGGSCVSSSSKYPAVMGTNGVGISGSTVTAVSTADSAIFSPATVTIENGSNVTSNAYYCGVQGNDGVTISGSTVSAVSSDDVAVFSQKDIKIKNSVLDVMAKTGMDGIKSNGTMTVSGTWLTTSGTETFESGISDNVRINGTEGVVIGNVTLPGDVKLPLGTTLTFTDGSTITVPSGVTFTNNGTVTGDIHVTTNGTTICTGHTGGTASCAQKAKCLVCGNEYGELRTTHKLTKTESKEATCAEAGNKEYWTCSECKKLFLDSDGKTETTLTDVTLTTSAHSYATVWKQDDTSHWHECSTCNGKADNAAHTFVWAVDREATTTEKGSKHEVCSVCGYVKAAVDIPVIATEPTTATESTTATTPTTGIGNLTTPQTGDNSHVALWVCLLMVSALGVVAMFLYERNRKAKG